MSAVADKLRAARETTVDVGKFKFRVRRPTELEMIELQGRAKGRAVLPYLIGWVGVTTLDMMPGGDAHPLDYDAAVAYEWLTDRLDLLQPLADGVFAAYDAHEKSREAAAKN